MKSKKKEKSKNLHLALYFGFLIVLIIAISVLFKSFDVIRKSQFDGKHRFTVMLLSDNGGDVVSVSPTEGSLTRLHLDPAIKTDSFGTLLVPIDGYVKTDSKFFASVKNFFPKTLLKKGRLQTNLTVIDLIRLSIYSLGVNKEKIIEEKMSVNDFKKLSFLSSTLFVDPTVSHEKLSIQITNATEVNGLGNKLAAYITNMGGNVVLVNSSRDMQETSGVIYKRDSYTVKKLMKILDIPGQKKESDSISDVVIVIGKDKEDFKF